MSNYSASQTASRPSTLWQIQAQAILELRRRQNPNKVAATAYQTFQERYLNDPVGFVRDCIQLPAGKTPADYQNDSMADLVKHLRLCLRGPHGLGKTALMAWIILWFALTRDGRTDWKIPITASSWLQLTMYLWPEVHKWAPLLRWDVIGRAPFGVLELQKQTLGLTTGAAFMMASKNAALMEGAHATEMLYIFDEAKQVGDDAYDSAEGAFATGKCMWFVASTPGEPQGRFYQIQHREPGYEDWCAKHVTLAEFIASGRINADWAEKRKAQWGEGSAVYINRVLGDFATANKDSIIPLSWIEQANERWLLWQADGFPGRVSIISADVAAGGLESDKSTIGVCVDRVKIKSVTAMSLGDPEQATMSMVGHIASQQDLYKVASIVDLIGLGTGIVHRLRERGYNCYGFNAAHGTAYRDQSGEFGFANHRAAAWWMTREMLDPANNFGVCLPPDDQLTGELTAPHYRITSGSRYLVEDKDNIRKRIGRSTDYADMVVQALVGPMLVSEPEPGDSQERVMYEPAIIQDRY